MNGIEKIVEADGGYCRKNERRKSLELSYSNILLEITFKLEQIRFNGIPCLHINMPN